MCEKNYIWNLATCSCKKCKYLASIIDDSVIMRDKIIEETKTFNENNIIGETKSFCILLTFLCITIALLIAVSIYYYLIKYKSQQKHLLPYYATNDKLKKFYINECFIDMDSNDELKEIDIEKCTCYFFDDIIKIKHFNLGKILIDKKSYQNI